MLFVGRHGVRRHYPIPRRLRRIDIVQRFKGSGRPQPPSSGSQHPRCSGHGRSWLLVLVLLSHFRQFTATSNAELGEDPGQVAFHRVGGNKKLLSDLGVGEVLGDEGRDPALSRRQAIPTRNGPSTGTASPSRIGNRVFQLSAPPAARASSYALGPIAACRSASVGASSTDAGTDRT